MTAKSPALNVPCPRCKAPAGAACVHPGQPERSTPHTERSITFHEAERERLEQAAEQGSQT